LPTIRELTVRNLSGDFASAFAQQEKILKGPTLGNAGR
jgi:hypothetical protein